jgi:uncharacterized membrane protein YccC
MKENAITIALIGVAIGMFVVITVKGVWQKKKLERAYSQRLLKLRRNLLVKALGNEYQVDSMIEFEQGKAGNFTLEEAMEAAIERWEKDNR